ncbi:hypothetical protein C8R43DRAFT_1039775 [Mycena crocata]|nr:hypothetical protein C8R43DRAFT_1039775 [Mycena crocata]
MDDDPWADNLNAWSQPTSKLPVAPAQDDDEEDITIPSWEAPGAVSWSDENSLWGARSPAADKFPAWHSPYDDLSLGKTSSTSLVAEDASEAVSEDEVLSEPAPPETPVEPPFSAWRSSYDELPSGKIASPAEDAQDEEQQEVHSEPAPVPEPESPAEPPFEPPLSAALSPSLSPPGSPDAFGTFESGLDDLPPTSDPWTPSQPSFVPDSADSAWGAAWAPSDAEERDEDVPAVVDEWEAAKQAKAMQDKHVPPELLASILLQFNELTNDLYPPTPTPNLDPDDYRASRHKGLQGIDSLNPNIIRLLPTDLTLPPPRPFLKSATAKHTAETLRLSRSAAFVRCSPLSHYGATKGSTAWETSVKRRPEAVGEPDLLPPGWRVVETKKEDVVVADKKKAGHGGLLSFFGRRTGTPPVVGEGATPRSSSPAPGSSSPRASIDSVRSPTSSTKSPTTTTTSAVASAVSPTAATSTSPPPPPPPIVPIASQSQSDPGPDVDPPAAAPSRVSRFLGRFGRKAQPASGGHQNLALSEGDFDFLADIEGAAPSFGPTTDFAMSGVLLDEPVPLPAKLAPPPRATSAPVAAPPQQHVNGERARAEKEKGRGKAVELAIFGNGKYSPPPAVKPFTPPLAFSSSAPPLAPSAPTSSSTPTPMSPVDSSDIDFSAWGFDDEEKSVPVANFGTARPPARQPLNTRAGTNARSVVPPPRRVTAIMSSGPSKPPAAIPKLDGTFGFPPPPRTQTQSTIAVLPPPPGSKAKAKANLALLDDDDDFSDFHAPTQISPINASATSRYDTTFSSSTSSERGLFSSTSSTSVPVNLFDDFDDFMQASPQEPTTLRTPSPPRLPAKPSHGRIPAPLSLAQVEDQDDTPLALIHGSKPSLSSRRAAQHQRTLSLVESAAATSGVRWPAPASPLPEALPPPDASDPFNFGGSSMQSQQAAFMGAAPQAFPPPPSATPPIRAFTPPVQTQTPVLAPPPQKTVPRFPPPPGAGMPRFPTPPSATAPLRALSPPAQSPSPMLPPPQKALMLTAQRQGTVSPPLSSAAPGKSSGGLSAQDLSFFEGL